MVHPGIPRHNATVVPCRVATDRGRFRRHDLIDVQRVGQATAIDRRRADLLAIELEVSSFRRARIGPMASCGRVGLPRTSRRERQVF
jgi:hypothetical protein